MGCCLSQQDCVSKGGMASGNCAAGFGVCCVIVVTGCSGTVANNCTYVRNDGFPGSDSKNGRTCTVAINRIADDICQIRLDFELTTQFPLGTEPGSCGGLGDSLTVSSPHSASSSAFPPTVCGTLSGQHMYFESGRSSSLAGRIEIVQGTVTADRRYNIKVSYIHCNSKVRAPSGCTQYFTGLTGTISSYNFAGDQILGNQVYTNCIRQSEGYCSVLYSESQITSPDPFDLSTGPTDSVTDNCMVANHVSIPSMVVQTLLTGSPQPQQDVVTIVPSMRCNKVFGSHPLTTVPGTLESIKNLPFVVGVRTLPSAGDSQADLGGFSLDYRQQPC
ncbi:uncharacterized protein LOC131893635 [Tigriopus californicus]|uniref:uncharacterized protein LOC131893635 n=1 Tax=Tigriopus californicus TaxID=6832 RepID=UPI0027DA5B72|nr:uncharacterized protein LOC131893635 [Tigriopus californicus]